jgi:hypothetical protein
MTQNNNKINPDAQSLQMAVSSCLLLVNSLRKTDRYIESIFMKGGCYQFHLFLKSVFPDAIPFIHKNKDHIVSQIGNKLFDITGIIENENEYSLLKKTELEMVEKWSFSRTHLLQLKECPFCEEPLVV